MKALAIAGAVTSSLLVATALTPARAADMTFERSLNVGKEPQNWLLHHGNYEGYRFSQLKEINTDTVKNLKPVFSVALGGYESGGRYKFGNLEGTPIVEDGMMYVTDGWGSVYAIDVSSGKKGAIKWKFDPAVDRAWAGDVACCGASTRSSTPRSGVDRKLASTRLATASTTRFPARVSEPRRSARDGRQRSTGSGNTVAASGVSPRASSARSDTRGKRNARRVVCRQGSLRRACSRRLRK